MICNFSSSNFKLFNIEPNKYLTNTYDHLFINYANAIKNINQLLREFMVNRMYIIHDMT